MKQGYEDATAMALVEQATETYALAEAAVRAAAARHLANDTSDIKDLGMVAGYLAATRDKIRWAKDGDGTVPADIGFAAALASEARSMKSNASTVRSRVKHGTGDLEPYIVINHENSINALRRALANTRKWLAEYNAAA